MLETILVVVTLAIVAFMAGRSLYRAMRGKNDGCECDESCHSGTCRDFAVPYQGQDPEK